MLCSVWTNLLKLVLLPVNVVAVDEQLEEVSLGVRLQRFDAVVVNVREFESPEQVHEPLYKTYPILSYLAFQKDERAAFSGLPTKTSMRVAANAWMDT